LRKARTEDIQFRRNHDHHHRHGSSANAAESSQSRIVRVHTSWRPFSFRPANGARRRTLTGRTRPVAPHAAQPFQHLHPSFAFASLCVRNARRSLRVRRTARSSFLIRNSLPPLPLARQSYAASGGSTSRLPWATKSHASRRAARPALKRLNSALSESRGARFCSACDSEPHAWQPTSTEAERRIFASWHATITNPAVLPDGTAEDGLPFPVQSFAFARCAVEASRGALRCRELTALAESSVGSCGGKTRGSRVEPGRRVERRSRQARAHFAPSNVSRKRTGWPKQGGCQKGRSVESSLVQ
jgi:hypothetical protein